MSTNAGSELAPPEVKAALKDIDGGEPNLLPLSALEAPLEVVVPQWRNSMPTPEFPECLWLYWNDAQVDVRQLEAPVTETDRSFAVAGLHAVEGIHRVRYRVRTYNDATADSTQLALTVDRTAPALAAGGGALVFPPLVVQDGVTGEYLDANSDKVVARVPDYAPRPGDVISWYWDTGQNEEALVDTAELASADIGKPIDLDFTGDMIRERGDGARLARYRVRDRAGNISAYAAYVTLDVDTSLLPRELSWPDVTQATGSGEQVTLAPLRAKEGATVVIPEEADIRPDDTEVWVQWGATGDVGAYRTQIPLDEGGRAYRVPKEAVAAYIGGILQVQYEIVDRNGTVHVSRQRGVTVLAIPPESLTTVQCANVSGSSLSLAAVPEGGAVLTLAPWVLISTDQCVTISVAGVYANGGEAQVVVLNRHRVSESEMIEGLGSNGDVVIPRGLLADLRMNLPFNVTVTVSFNAGETWPNEPNFRSLSPNLIA
jgi:hypothetical protein